MFRHSPTSIPMTCAPAWHISTRCQSPVCLVLHTANSWLIRFDERIRWSLWRLTQPVWTLVTWDCGEIDLGLSDWIVPLTYVGTFIFAGLSVELVTYRPIFDVIKYKEYITVTNLCMVTLWYVICRNIIGPTKCTQWQYLGLFKFF